MLIGTFLFNWGGEYPGKVCDIGFETHDILYRSVYPLVVQSYTIQDEVVNPQNPWKYTVASENFVFILRDVFQESNPGIKRDLPVRILHWQCERDSVLKLVRNVVAHAQKPDFGFSLNGRVHLNRRGSQFSRLLAAEVCASVLVILDTPRPEAV